MPITEIRGPDLALPARGATGPAGPSGLEEPIVENPGNYDATEYDLGSVIAITPSGAQALVRLPNAVDAGNGSKITVIKKDSSAFFVRVEAADGGLLDYAGPSFGMSYSGQLSRPLIFGAFYVELGSTTVTVVHPMHGLAVGNSITFSGAQVVGGVTINGTWTVSAVLDVNSYQFVAGNAATSTTWGAVPLSLTPTLPTFTYPGPVTGSLPNLQVSGPFTTINGDATIRVRSADHGLKPGDLITIAGAATFNGVNPNGAWTVGGFIDFDNYSIEHSTPATATGSGGGTATTFVYPVVIGAQFQEDPFWTLLPFGRLRPDSLSVGALGPFETTSGSTSVTVTHSGHGLLVGDTVRFYDAEPFNGFNPNGTFTVASVLGSAHYTITAPGAASASGTGGTANDVDGRTNVGWEYINEQARFVGVIHPAHGLIVGSSVTFSGVTPIAGLDMNGTFTVTSVNGPGTYFVQHASRANASVRGGGYAVASNIPIRLRVMHTGEDRMWRAGTHARVEGVSGTMPAGVNGDLLVINRPGAEKERTGKATRAIDVDVGTPWAAGWTASGGTMTFIQKFHLLRVRGSRITYVSDGTQWTVDKATDDIYTGPKAHFLWTENLGFTGETISTQANSDFDFYYNSWSRRLGLRSLNLKENGDPVDLTMARITKDYVGVGFWPWRFIEAGAGLGAMFWQASAYPSGITQGSASSITCVAEESFNALGSGAGLQFGTTSKGNQEPQTRMYIDSLGAVMLGGGGGGIAGNRSLEVKWHQTATGGATTWGMVRGTRDARAIFGANTSNSTGTVLLAAKGPGSIDCFTGGDGTGLSLGVLQFRVLHVANADRAISVKGAVGPANPEISTVGGGYVKFGVCPVLPSFTVATGPAVQTPTAGAKMFVTNLNGTVAGGEIIGDGANWRKSHDLSLYTA